MARPSKPSSNPATVGTAPGALASRPRSERIAAGKALRATVPRESHAAWKPRPRQIDPVDVLVASNRGRVAELVPIRFGRMLQSPFTFLRGSAALMATDLATVPATGIRVQACGDCHLLNFGCFATPERNLVLDINDFDETLPAPWEWDIKRLCASLAVAARDSRFEDELAARAASACARAYREHLRECSRRSPLEVWYERLDAQTLIDESPDEETRKVREALAEKARTRIGEYLVPKLTTAEDGRQRLLDQPPVMFHVEEKGIWKHFREGIEDYRASLPEDRRVLFDRYRLEDFAAKVVGIGSVGTRCFVGLFLSPDGHPLLLQMKEARRSVLAPFAGKSQYPNQGQRVVMGQRLMQSSSDIFLGWTRGFRGVDYFVRQLRDMKLPMQVAGATPVQLKRIAGLCGRVLARAHARSGDAALISGYLGKSEVFDDAMGRFALAYADQTQRDHARLVAAVRSGRVDALVEQDL